MSNCENNYPRQQQGSFVFTETKTETPVIQELDNLKKENDKLKDEVAFWKSLASKFVV